MAQPESPTGREFRQMRHDVDDVYRLLTETQKLVEGTRETTGALLSGQKRHGLRLDEIQLSLDRQDTRMDTMEDTQRRQGDRLGRVDVRLGRVEGLQQEQGERLGRVEGLQQEQGERLGRVEGLQQEQGERLGRVEGRLDEILALLRGPTAS